MTERVRRFGGALSHALLDPSCRAFVMDGVDGVVAFQVIGNCAVELGDPICATAHKGALQDAFVAHCRERGWSTIAVATTEAKSEQRESGAVGFADLLFVDPRNDPATGRAGRHLRQNLARVRREGIRVDEYSGDHDE
ncbi:MAG TPA: phosphatidylglycerol lysyltransferase domain-containing protein, partial [Polyangiaceae bacterium]|nr:phosphatidylglycerol lysyltransferase domain-containing protein [Polyangiaceae bacterium]